MAIRRVQKNGEGIVSVRKKSNSGRGLKTVYTTVYGFAVAAAIRRAVKEAARGLGSGLGNGLWTGFLPSRTVLDHYG